MAKNRLLFYYLGFSILLFSGYIPIYGDIIHLYRVFKKSFHSC